MGVYVMKCLHGPYVKVGHHRVTRARPNVYYRVAGRGFHACVHPACLDGKLGMRDLELLAWYPTLTMSDEKAVHRAGKATRVGEFHPAEALPTILADLDARGARESVDEAAKQQAVAWAGKRAARARKRKKKAVRVAA